MPAPFFTTNDSEIIRLEGLYVKERNPPAQISGVFLGVIGVVGEAIRGPVDKPIEITSEGRFREVFGGRDQGSGGAISSPMWKALANKPFGKLVCVRAAAAAAVAATHTFADATPTNILRVDATSVGSWGNNVTIDIVVPSTDAVSGRFDLKATYLGKSYVYKNLDLTGSNDNTLSVIGSDDGNVIKVTKLNSGTPIAAAAVALSTGADGTVADSDFTATARGLNVLNAQKGLGAIFIAERSSSALKSVMATLAAGASDRLYLMGADSETVSISTASTEVATLRSDRIVYCYNHVYTIDHETATEMLTSPVSWMASILSQIDIDIHPGEEDTKKFTAGITRLYQPGLVREDYISLKNAGICALEEDDGFAFVSGVTTSLVSGKEQITRRRMADYIQQSLAKSLKFVVKKKNVQSRKEAIASMSDDFLGDLKKGERVVANFAVDMNALNTSAQQAAGIVKALVRVQLISHILELVLETEIGTSVQIKEAA
jgi:hypothetical protein